MRRESVTERLRSMVENASFQERIKSMLPAIIKPERFAAVALTSLSRNQSLLDCTPVSLIRCLLQAATVGLEVDNGLGHAYLVPFRDRKAGTTECTLILGYRGLVQLMLRSNGVSAVYSQVVREGDAFDFELGLTPKLSHRPVMDPEKQLTAAYAIVYMKDGTRLFDVMSRAEIERVRSRSRASASGPWVTDYHEMSKKTVLRRLAKLAPMSVEDQRLVMADELADAGQAQLQAFAPHPPLEESETQEAIPAPKDPRDDGSTLAALTTMEVLKGKPRSPVIPMAPGIDQGERARIALERLLSEHEPGSKAFNEACTGWVRVHFPELAAKGLALTEDDWRKIADAAEAAQAKAVEESWGKMGATGRDPA